MVKSIPNPYLRTKRRAAAASYSSPFPFGIVDYWRETKKKGKGKRTTTWAFGLAAERGGERAKSSIRGELNEAPQEERWRE